MPINYAIEYPAKQAALQKAQHELRIRKRVMQDLRAEFLLASNTSATRVLLAVLDEIESRVEKLLQ